MLGRRAGEGQVTVRPRKTPREVAEWFRRQWWPVTGGAVLFAHGLIEDPRDLDVLAGLGTRSAAGQVVADAAGLLDPA